jgi:hypothetical protein
MRRAATSLLLGVLLAGTAVAQPAEPAPLVLQLAGGTRALGVGNGFAAGRGAEVLFYNPAQMFVLRGTTISLQRFGSASTLATLSTVGPFGKVSLGAGAQYLDYHASPTESFFTRPSSLTLRGPINSSSLAATVAIGVQWKGMRFGAAGKYLEERVGGLRDRGVAFDLGVARDLMRGTLALTLQNLGGDLELLEQEGELPTRLSLGAALPTIFVSGYFDFTAFAAVSRERDGRIVPGGGAELIYQPVQGWTFIGRAGARRVVQGPERAESPVTLGGSFGLDRLWVDYVFQPYQGPGAAHRVGIRIQ